MAKARCGECGLRFDAPNEARGKTVSCPDCDSRVRVPRSKKKAKKKRRPAEEEESDAPQSPDSFLDIDLKRVDDHDVIICPKCAQEVGEDDEECPHCGVNIETGVLSEKQKRLKKTRGPDPDEFTANLWGDSFGFMGRHWKLALWSTLYLSIFMSLWFFAAHMSFWCSRKPPKVFWTALGLVFLLGALGWLFQVYMDVVRIGLKKKREPGPRDIVFDFFQCMSYGVRIAAYPIVVFLPFFWTGIGILVPIICLPIALAHFVQKYTYRGWLMYFQIKIFMKNAGAVMMWFLVFLSAYGIQLIAILVIMLTSAGGKIYSGTAPDGVENWRAHQSPPESWAWDASGMVGDNARDWAASISGSNEGFTYSALMHGFVYLLFFSGALLIASAFAWPSLMVARASALFAYYRQMELDHISEHRDGELAGFWIRYQATIVDTLIFMLSPFVVPAPKLVVTMLWSLNGGLYFIIAAAIMKASTGVDMMPTGATGQMLYALSGLAAVANFWSYFTFSESSFERATVAKAAIGLMVTDEEAKQITVPHAAGRTAAKLITFALGGGLGFLAWYLADQQTDNPLITYGCAIVVGLPAIGLLVNSSAGWDEEKRAPHDFMTKTRTRWRGLQE